MNIVTINNITNLNYQNMGSYYLKNTGNVDINISFFATVYAAGNASVFVTYDNNNWFLYQGAIAIVDTPTQQYGNFVAQSLRGVTGVRVEPNVGTTLSLVIVETALPVQITQIGS